MFDCVNVANVRTYKIFLLSGSHLYLFFSLLLLRWIFMEDLLWGCERCVCVCVCVSWPLKTINNYREYFNLKLWLDSLQTFHFIILLFAFVCCVTFFFFHFAASLCNAPTVAMNLKERNINFDVLTVGRGIEWATTIGACTVIACNG